MRSKSRYTFPQLEALWVGNGGNPKKAQLAAAVAMAESAGRTNARSRNPSGGTNVGPWQVDDKSHPGVPDPVTDINGYTKYVIALSKNGESWGIWETFVKGTYKKFLIGKAPDKTLLEQIATGPLGDAAAAGANAIQPLQAIGELAIGLTELVLTPEGWRRILKVVIGGVILIWALNQLGKSFTGTSVVGKAARTASTVTGAGAVRNAVVSKTAAATGGKVAGRIG